MSSIYNRLALCVTAALLVHFTGDLAAIASGALPAQLGAGQSRQTPQSPPSSDSQGGDVLWLDSVHSRDDFDLLARVYYRGRFYALPHLMFVIDRQDKSRIYYVNSRKFRFHKDFVNGLHLSLERGLAFYEDNYLKDNRRFILGSIAYQQTAEKFTFELWEGDLAGRQLIVEAYQCLTKSFFTDVYYKPTSDR